MRKFLHYITTRIIKVQKMPDSPNKDPIVIALFSEMLASEQLMRGRLSRALPKGMELSHFVLLNYLKN